MFSVLKVSRLIPTFFMIGLPLDVMQRMRVQAPFYLKSSLQQYQILIQLTRSSNRPTIFYLQPTAPLYAVNLRLSNSLRSRGPARVRRTVGKRACHIDLRYQERGRDHLEQSTVETAYQIRSEVQRVVYRWCASGADAKEFVFRNAYVQKAQAWRVRWNKSAAGRCHLTRRL